MFKTANVCEKVACEGSWAFQLGIWYSGSVTGFAQRTGSAAASFTNGGLW